LIVEFLPHGIAIVNSTAVVTLVMGYLSIKNRRVRRHRIFMLLSFALIVSFLVMYLTRLFLGGVKHFTGPEWVRDFVYLPSLTIHLGLSIISVPLVLYNILTGLLLPVQSISSTKHRRVGKWAVRAWTLSLILGVLVYFLLNYL